MTQQQKACNYTAVNIKNAISFQYSNPNSPSFKHCFDYIETFKSSPGCLETCLSLASPSECDEVRHFALQTIAGYVASRWAFFDDEAVAALKRMCADLILNGTKAAADEKAFIKEKVAQVVCVVAICSYPLKWQNFFKDLLAIAKMSEKGLELVFRVFKNLRDETELNLQLDLERRENLKQSLNSYNNDVITLAEQFLTFTLPNLQNNQPEKDRKCAETEILVRSALDCLAPNIQTPLEQIFKGDLVDILCRLSLAARFRAKALGCLLSVVCHKSPALQSVQTKRFKAKVFLIWESVVQNFNLVSLNVTPIAPEDDDNALELLLSIGNFLILNHKAATFQDNETELKTIFISSLLRAFERVHLKVLPEILLLWQTLNEKKFIFSLKRSHFWLKEMFRLCWQRMAQAENENAETDEEIDALKVNFLNHTSLWMKSVFLIDKTLYIDVLEKRLCELLCAQSATCIGGKLDDERTSQRNWTNFCKMVKIGFCEQSLSAKSLKRMGQTGLHSKCKKILKLILSNDSDDPVISKAILECLPLFMHLIDNVEDSDLLKQTLEHFFSRIKKFGANLSQEQSGHFAAVRSEAVKSLIKISKTSFKKLSSFYVSWLEVTVQRIVSDEEDVYGLYEMLLNVAEEGALLEKRRFLIEKLFSGAVNKLNSAPFLALCNPENLYLTIAATPECAHTRRAVLSGLSIANLVLRAVTKAEASYTRDYRRPQITLRAPVDPQATRAWTLLQPLLPAICALCRALAAVFADTALLRRALEPLRLGQWGAEAVLFSAEELAALPQQLRAEGRAEMAAHFESVAQWLRETRRECFGVLSLGANLSPSFFDGDSNAILDTVLYRLPAQSTQAFVDITDFIISPFVARCAILAPKRFKAFIEPILSVYFDVAEKKIEADENALRERGSMETPFDVRFESVSDALQERLLLLTRSVSQLLHSFSLIAGAQQPQSLYRFLFSSARALPPLCSLVGRLFRGRDDVARNNAYRFASHAAALAGAEGGVLETLTKLMLAAVLALPELREVDDELAVFVRAVLFKMTKLNRDLPLKVLSAQLPAVGEKDLRFLANAFRSKDLALQKKKTAQFLLKLGGRDALRLEFRKTGALTGSVRKKRPRRKKGGKAAAKLEYLFDNVLDQSI